ncbi:Anthranilate phosphoribosyltransferase like [hydrothermal vent metagenome]|uniref:Anthranilate phosphoribosyltransferase like n=1 Tax=hydrothermal vent metagenome TaxID=652676 RepID=A0A1W1BTX4_9ZZZZ
MNFHTYIKAVGTGPKSNHDLSFEESKDMMNQILKQEIYPEQIAAFLTGWRLKPETITEFRGALAACDEASSSTEVKNSIELGYPFDGKAKNPYLLPLIAKALKKSDLNLVVAGDDTVPAKDGITLKQLYNAITFEENLHYFDRASYCPSMHKLSEIRRHIGLRTGLNTIEKLPGISKSEYAITGVFHKPYVKKYVGIFGDRYKRLALIQGNEGTPELFGKGRLWIAEGDSIEEFHIDPKDFDIHYEKSFERITQEESLKQLYNPTDEFLKLAKLNAAIYLFITEKTKSIQEGYNSLTTF